MRCCGLHGVAVLKVQGPSQARRHVWDRADCDIQGRKINITNSKTLVGWWMSRLTITRVTSDLPECKEPFETKNNNNKPEAKKKKKRNTRKKKNGQK